MAIVTVGGVVSAAADRRRRRLGAAAAAGGEGGSREQRHRGQGTEQEAVRHGVSPEGPTRAWIGAM
ncbi:hypothetical protein [Piscinibacter sakaiensis]|uniref:hypothetical protein n=1 Tax=Piscinibacter sakaiensis TaxID=1547922 RepID=UPI00372D605F